MSEIIKNRIHFLGIFDAKNSNPNGDPDAAGQPRIDPMTGLCLVTDVCLKRKIRNEITLMKGKTPGYKLYIESNCGETLNARDEEAFRVATGVTIEKLAEYKQEHSDVDEILRQFVCDNYYDVRTFGGVMTRFQSAKLNSGMIRGPVQISMAESVVPVEMNDLTLVRTIVATEDEVQKGNTTFGQKSIIPYGLFTFTGSISPMLARATGFSEDDQELFFTALMNMFEHDQAAIRNQMVLRKLVIFRHDSAYGNAPAHKLYERVHIRQIDPAKPARNYSDFIVDVDSKDLPKGVSIEVRD